MLGGLVSLFSTSVRLCLGWYKLEARVNQMPRRFNISFIEYQLNHFVITQLVINELVTQRRTERWKKLMKKKNNKNNITACVQQTSSSVKSIQNIHQTIINKSVSFQTADARWKLPCCTASIHCHNFLSTWPSSYVILNISVSTSSYSRSQDSNPLLGKSKGGPR